MPDSVFISASLLRDYLDCPRKVYYRLNHPDLSIQTPDMFVGTVVHNALEKFWNDRDKASLYVVNECNIPSVSGALVSKASKCIENFFDLFSNIVTDRDQIEYRFKIPFCSSFLVGKMDRITSTGSIIDWKTSSLTSKDISKDVQFILYQYVYEQVFKKPPTGVMKICLVDGGVVNYSVNRLLEYNLINNLIPNVVDDINNGNLPPVGLFTGKCYRCPFNVACSSDLR